MTVQRTDSVADHQVQKGCKSPEKSKRRTQSVSDISNEEKNNRLESSETLRQFESNTNSTAAQNPASKLSPNLKKRSHSLPHRYKVHKSSPKAGVRSEIKCYSPQEFRRGLGAMQSWFSKLDDNQRTVALQSIWVR